MKSHREWSPRLLNRSRVYSLRIHCIRVSMMCVSCVCTAHVITRATAHFPSLFLSLSLFRKHACARRRKRGETISDPVDLNLKVKVFQFRGGPILRGQDRSSHVYRSFLLLYIPIPRFESWPIFWLAVRTARSCIETRYLCAIGNGREISGSSRWRKLEEGDAWQRAVSTSLGAQDGEIIFGIDDTA